MTDIFREIDEDLRRDSFLKLWQRYGSYVIAAAVAIVLATAAYVGWQHYTESRRLQRGAEFSAAADLADKGAAVKAFDALGQGSDDYATLALLREAALKAKAGDQAAATAIYERLAGDQSIDAPFRDLAVILLALHGLDKADPAALTARLQPLTADTSPWRYSALELTGLLAQRAGDTAKAKGIFTTLSDDPRAPSDLRGRAAELLARLKSEG